MAYFVYCHTNKANGKKYVGITSQRPLERWQNGKHYSRHKAFYSDILKYGWENFRHEVLYSGLSEEEAKKKESNLIIEWDLLNDELGYNKQKGGKIPKQSASTIEKLSELNKGDKNPFYNRKHTKKTKELMKENRPKKSVVCIETGVIYESTREAQRQTGADHGDIGKCCKGTKKTAGGFCWKYA